MTFTAFLKLSSFLFFLLLSALFSSAETAFTSINPIKLRSLVDKQIQGSQLLSKILETPHRLIIAILIGNNFANVAASALATVVILNQFKKYGLFNFAYGMAFITGIMTFILLTFGEITPKTIALKHAERMALFLSKPIFLLMILLSPLISFFLYISKSLSRVFGVSESESSSLLTSEDLKSAVSMSQEVGLIEPEEQKMITNIMDFSDTIVREVMTPRTDAICIEVTGDIRDVIEMIISKGHSRIPVFKDNVDNIVGVVYAKDLLTIQHNKGRSVPIANFLREAVFIPETKGIESLLHQMKRSKFHIAIVVDEHGGFSGIVTLEDIIEEIFGEIQDEYDEDEQPEFITVDASHFVVDAGINIDDLSEEINFKFPEDDDFDTLGGFVLTLTGNFPKKGDTVSYKNLEILVKETRKRRILQLELHLK